MTLVASAPFQVLLVEDNPADVRLCREALRAARSASELEVVGDGAEALAFVRREGRHQAAPRPDLILLDLNLPRLDGREVLASLKRDPEYYRIPIVILSTSQAPQDLVDAYQLGANAFVTKPMDLERFLEVIASIDRFWLDTARLCRT